MAASSEEIQKIQWHPGFYGGIELELIKYKGKLTYEPEHQLSKEPIRMDLLIIKKDPQTVIEDEVGRIFRGRNIVEYKSPDDSLSLDDLYKTLGYAFLYKGLGETVDEIPASELTVSVFRDSYPREMFDALMKQGAQITEQFQGIYYVTGITQVPTQVVVTSRLSDEHPVLRILSNHASADDVRRFVDQTKELSDPGDRNNIDAVLQVSISANQALYDELGKEQDMSDVVREYFHKVCKEDIEQERKNAVLESLYSLVHDGILSLATGAARANMTEATFTENMNRMYS